MKYISFVFLSIFIATSCHRKAPFAVASEIGIIPTCIQQKIDSIKQVPAWNPPAQVEEYDYNGKRVFLFSADCCDFFSTAFDENCNYICAPSGGFTGRGDGLCKDFNDKAKLVNIVWKDERKSGAKKVD